MSPETYRHYRPSTKLKSKRATVRFELPLPVYKKNNLADDQHDKLLESGGWSPESAQSQKKMAQLRKQDFQRNKLIDAPSERAGPFLFFSSEEIIEMSKRNHFDLNCLKRLQLHAQKRQIRTKSKNGEIKTVCNNQKEVGFQRNMNAKANAKSLEILFKNRGESSQVKVSRPGTSGKMETDQTKACPEIFLPDCIIEDYCASNDNNSPNPQNSQIGSNLNCLADSNSVKTADGIMKLPQHLISFQPVRSPSERKRTHHPLQVFEVVTEEGVFKFTAAASTMIQTSEKKDANQFFSKGTADNPICIE